METLQEISLSKKMMKSTSSRHYVNHSRTLVLRPLHYIVELFIHWNSVENNKYDITRQNITVSFK